MKYLKYSLLSFLLATSLSVTANDATITNTTENSAPVINQILKNMLDRTAFTCGNKRNCGQMSSCKEAYFYLKTCGLKRLDRDKDGIPCESICGNGR